MRIMLAQNDKFFWVRFKFFLLIALFLTIVFCFRDIAVPFIVGMVIAYVAAPLANCLSKYMQRSLAVFVVIFILYASFILCISLMIPVVYHELHKLYRYFSLLEPSNLASLLSGHLRFHFKPESISNLWETLPSHAIDFLRYVIGIIINSGQSMVKVSLTLLLSPFIAFYGLQDGVAIRKYWSRNLPVKDQERLLKFANSCDAVLGKFIKGQFTVLLIASAFYSLSYIAVGLDGALTLGLISGISALIPYVGALFSLLVTVIMALLQSGWSSLLLWVLVIFSVGHILDTVVLMPKVLGKKLGLSPIMTIFSLLLSSKLFNVWGLIIALPFGILVQEGFAFLLRQYREVVEKVDNDDPSDDAKLS